MILQGPNYKTRKFSIYCQNRGKLFTFQLQYIHIRIWHKPRKRIRFFNRKVIQSPRSFLQLPFYRCSVMKKKTMYTLLQIKKHRTWEMEKKLPNPFYIYLVYSGVPSSFAVCCWWVTRSSIGITILRFSITFRSNPLLFPLHRCSFFKIDRHNFLNALI